MSLTISGEGGGGDLPNLQPGIYQGTCYSIVDMGTTDQEYKGVASKKTRVHLCFEITHALDPENNPITMEDGREIKATDEHPVLTLDGWKQVKELTIDDIIVDIQDHS